MAPSTFLEPLTCPPLSPPHTQTIILLHGRGSRASTFGPVLLDTPFPHPSHPTTPPTTLRTLLPHTKFIFPTAPRSRATIYKRSIINQWFDGWHVDAPQARDWLATDGLQRTTSFVHDLIRAEAELVPGGVGSVVVGGISQGCAASLVAAILWEGEGLGGVVGICGYLPFSGAIMAALGSDGKEDDGETDDGFDPFERGEEEGESQDEVVGEEDPGSRAVRELRQLLELDGSSPKEESRPRILSTPVFLGHGEDDEKVPLKVGRTMADCLAKMGIDVSWHIYPELGHWFSQDMLKDIALFLQTKDPSH